MDGRTFDDLTRAAGETRSRRGALGVLAAALAAVSLPISQAAASKKRNGKGNGKKKKRCRKLDQGCSKKKKCCNGLTCVDGVCRCPAGTNPSNGACVPTPPPPPPPPPPPSPPPPPAPECTKNGDCGANEICQNGACVPEPPECVNDTDCGNNEICENGACVPECVNDNDCANDEICQNNECIPNPSGCEVVDGRCIQRCEAQADCPGASSCRNFSPETSPFIEDGVCIDEAFFLCDTAPCTENDDCASDEVCVMLSCEGDIPVGRCQEFSVF